MRALLVAATLLLSLTPGYPARAQTPPPGGEPNLDAAMTARWRRNLAPHEAGPERPVISLMLAHRDELGLSAAQVQDLERLRTEFERTAIRRDADIRVAETELRALLRAEAVDMAAVEAKVREVERMRAELRLSRIRTLEQGKAQLTAEQRGKLASLAAAVGDRSGPHRPGPGPAAASTHVTG